MSFPVPFSFCFITSIHQTRCQGHLPTNIKKDLPFSTSHQNPHCPRHHKGRPNSRGTTFFQTQHNHYVPHFVYNGTNRQFLLAISATFRTAVSELPSTSFFRGNLTANEFPSLSVPLVYSSPALHFFQYHTRILIKSQGLLMICHKSITPHSFFYYIYHRYSLLSQALVPQ